MPLGTASDAACMASPRCCTTVKRRFKLHHAGKHHGRVLAQTQTGRGRTGLDHRRRFALQRLQGRQAGDEQGRLADDGRIEFLFRTFESRSAPDRSPALRLPDRTVGGPTQAFRQLTPHAHRLGTLTRKQKGNLVHADDLPAAECGQSVRICLSRAARFCTQWRRPPPCGCPPLPAARAVVGPPSDSLVSAAGRPPDPLPTAVADLRREALPRLRRYGSQRVPLQDSLTSTT